MGEHSGRGDRGKGSNLLNTVPGNGSGAVYSIVTQCGEGGTVTMW